MKSIRICKSVLLSAAVFSLVLPIINFSYANDNYDEIWALLAGPTPGNDGNGPVPPGGNSPTPGGGGDVPEECAGLAVGESCGGGVVACTTPFNLIASTNDNYGGSGVAWSGNTTVTVVGARSDTDGAANTVAIVVDNNTPNHAATICDSLTEGGFSDWYLPAKDELDCLYGNRVAIGGFISATYWSSTESSANVAWFQNFGSGAQFFNFKNSSHQVRCVRAFTP